ncbi:type II secretion system protein [Teredinibacter franksiae]|uniref:type II secretion system protein n=1 Tax=Teredinibacter franksiae TaxID=2761453 RepID=UPI001629BC17|nr:type II secretion system protein [Teredinibacter franksiae]
MPSGKALLGLTLVEMLVSLVILSILAGAVFPYAKLTKQRSQETELRYALRSIRTAIDMFHTACMEGEIASATDEASRNCYPKSLEYLYLGVEDTSAEGQVLYFLRRIPKDPFREPGVDVEDHWEVRGYEDDPEGSWSGDDVYDVRVVHDRVAIDGSEYRTW